MTVTLKTKRPAKQTPNRMSGQHNKTHTTTIIKTRKKKKSNEIDKQENVERKKISLYAPSHMACAEQNKSMTCSTEVELETSTLCYWTRQHQLLFFLFSLKIERTKKKHRWTLKHGYQAACGDDSPSSRLKMKKMTMNSHDSMGVTRTRQWARLTQDPALRRRFGTGTMILRWHANTHTCTRASTHKLIPLFLVALQIKTLFCRWPLDQRKFVLILVFLLLCVNKAGASTSNLDLSFNLFPRAYSLMVRRTGWCDKFHLIGWYDPSLQVKDKSRLVCISSKWAVKKNWCSDDPSLEGLKQLVWYHTVRYLMVW